MAKTPQDGGFLRNAVAVFEDSRSLDLAVEALRDTGIQPDRLSLLAPERSAADGSGQSSGIAALGPGEAAGEKLSSSGLLGEDLGRLLRTANDSLGAALSTWLPGASARFLAKQLEAGNLVLWVHLRDAPEERRVCSLLLDLSGHSVQVHDLRLEGHG